MGNKLINVIEENFYDKQSLKKKLADVNIVDIAEVFNYLEKEKILYIFRLLPKDKAADIFSYMSCDSKKIIIECHTETPKN